MKMDIISNTSAIDGAALLTPVTKTFNSGGSFVILPNYPIYANAISSSGEIVLAGNNDVVLTMPPPTWIGGRKIMVIAGITYEAVPVGSVDIRATAEIFLNGASLCYAKQDYPVNGGGTNWFTLNLAYMLNPSVAGVGSLVMKLQNLCDSIPITVTKSYMSFMEF